MGTPIVMTEVNQLQNVSVCGLHTNNACHMVASFRTTILVPYCPACRTTLVATRFRVAAICPIIQVPHCIRVFFYFV